MSTATGPQTTKHRPGEILPVALAASVTVYKGAAAAVVLGTGYGTPLVPSTLTHQFIGVWGETITAAGVAGTTFTQIIRQGCFSFNQTGTTITAASIGEPAYFADDSTITLTEGTTYAGVITAVDVSGNVWVDISQAVRTSPEGGRNIVVLTGSADAINPHEEQTILINSTGVDATTLAAPTSGTDDGVKLTVISGSAHAHTITATGLLNTGASAVNVVTFAAHAGASVILIAYGGAWYTAAQIAATFS
jgi:hypothetical protein